MSETRPDSGSEAEAETRVEPPEATTAEAPRAVGEYLPIGEQLGRFVILSKLGEGGMAVVHAAYDAELDRKVAIKVLRGDSHSERQSLGQARLLREAQAMARLSHPNIVHVYEVGKIGKDVFIAMEFIQGKTLREWLRAGPSWHAVVQVFIQAGEGLAAAHAAGIVHRDFKPKSECPPQTPPLPPSGRILADGGDLRGTVCRAMPRHAAVLATAWQRSARCRTSPPPHKPAPLPIRARNTTTPSSHGDRRPRCRDVPRGSWSPAAMSVTHRARVCAAASGALGILAGVGSGLSIRKR